MRRLAGCVLVGLLVSGCSDDGGGSAAEGAGTPGATGAASAPVSPGSGKSGGKAGGSEPSSGDAPEPGSASAPSPEKLMAAYMKALIDGDCDTVVALTYYEPGGVSNAEDDLAQCRLGTTIKRFEVREVHPVELDPPPEGVDDSIAVVVEVKDSANGTVALDNPMVLVDGGWRMFKR